MMTMSMTMLMTHSSQTTKDYENDENISFDVFTCAKSTFFNISCFTATIIRSFGVDAQGVEITLVNFKLALINIWIEIERHRRISLSYALFTLCSYLSASNQHTGILVNRTSYLTHFLLDTINKEEEPPLDSSFRKSYLRDFNERISASGHRCKFNVPVFSFGLAINPYISPKKNLIILSSTLSKQFDVRFPVLALASFIICSVKT